MSDWTCPGCHAVNAADDGQCQRCGAAPAPYHRGPGAEPVPTRPKWTPAPLEACVPVEQVRALIATLTAQMGQEAPMKSTPASLASSARTDLYFAERQLEYWREAHPEDEAEIGLLERKVDRLKKAAWTAERRREAGAEATERG